MQESEAKMYENNTPVHLQAFMGFRESASPDDWAEVLSTFPLFAGVSDRRLRKLARDATFAEYGPGDIVIESGEPSDSVFVILSGSAKARGKPAARTLRTGDYFGELGVLDGVSRSATVVATGELHVMKVQRRAFLRFVQEHPTVSLEMASRLGSQIRRLEAQPAQR